MYKSQSHLLLIFILSRTRLHLIVGYIYIILYSERPPSSREQSSQSSHKSIGFPSLPSLLSYLYVRGVQLPDPLKLQTHLNQVLFTFLSLLGKKHVHTQLSVRNKFVPAITRSDRYTLRSDCVIKGNGELAAAEGAA